MESAAIALVNELEITNENPDYPVLDWQETVANEDARERCWDWVVNEMKLSRYVGN